ncbi:MAG: head GIN domain-containing protein [Ginsengibacter sp.]
MMLKTKYFIAIIMVFTFKTTIAQTTTPVKPFDKVIVSPHVQATFIEGDQESVTIENSTVSNDKINIEVKDKTLRIYLDGAKEITKNEKSYENGYKEKHSIYNGTVVTATITYKTLNDLSVRGEEIIVCKSPLKVDKFKLKIYGESHVFLNEVTFEELHTTIYGESDLVIKSGSIKDQRFTAYGESKINSLAITSNTTKITAYGEAHFQVNVLDKMKVTSFGEAVVEYKGNPEITKGLNIGEVQIARIE